jgi:hypothetical protein
MKRISSTRSPLPVERALLSSFQLLIRSSERVRERKRNLHIFSFALFRRSHSLSDCVCFCLSSSSSSCAVVLFTRECLGGETRDENENESFVSFKKSYLHRISHVCVCGASYTATLIAAIFFSLLSFTFPHPSHMHTRRCHHHRSRATSTSGKTS